CACRRPLPSLALPLLPLPPSPTTALYPLSLHDALPIYARAAPTPPAPHARAHPHPPRPGRTYSARAACASAPSPIAHLRTPARLRTYYARAGLPPTTPALARGSGQASRPDTL